MIVELLVLGGVVAAGGTGAALYRHRVRPGWPKLLRETPRGPAAEASSGLVRLEGTARAGAEPLTSPVWGASCLAYRVEIEEAVGRGAERQWHLRHRDATMCRFRLEDASGAAVIEPTPLPILELEREPSISQGLLEELPPRAAAFVDACGIDRQGILFSKRLRVSEWRLDAGEPCTVIGTVLRREIDPAPPAGGYREAPTVPIVSAGDGDLWIADRHGEALRRALRRRLAMELVMSAGAGGALAWLAGFLG
jgi:hypothetical protein